MAIDWGQDHVHDIIMPLQRVNQLGLEQSMIGPTRERTAEMLRHVESVLESMETLRDQLQEELEQSDS